MRMNTEQPMEERLWNYIDGLSSQAEKSAIEALLTEDREWREKYNELLNIHRLLDASELDAPSMRFTRNVMEEIARFHVAPATRTYINKNIIRGIGAFFLTMILGLTVFVLTRFNWTGGSSDNVAAKDIDLGLSKLKNVDVSKAFNGAYITVFMLIAVVMGFILLDLYLQRKKTAANP
ncbi:MAG TPA: hypothetical protein VHE54_17590 [Puia sp.]|nr:hypothetical protein [Puia sp.]